MAIALFLLQQAVPQLEKVTLWTRFIHSLGEAQPLAAWLYTLVTMLLFVLMYLQLRETRGQVDQMREQVGEMRKQLLEMRRAGDLETFKAFYEIWDDEDVRESRRFIYSTFGKAMNIKDDLERQAQVESLIGTLSPDFRKQVDRVIYRSNLAGLLWEEGLLSPDLRDKLIGYIYKTVIASWDCLWPYIDFVRARRRELPGSITYAKPFERLKNHAEKRLGDDPRPRASEY